MTGAPIDFYFDFSSPYGYVAAHRIEALGAELGREICWRPILLGVVFKTTGQTPLVSQPLRGPYHVNDLQRTARRLGIPFQLPEGFPLATMAAARAFHWLDGKSSAEAKKLALVLLNACFADAVNITAAETVAGIGAKIGLDAAEIQAAIADPANKEKLRQATDDAIAAGVFGSPYFIVDGEPFWGNDRIPDLRDWIVSGGW